MSSRRRLSAPTIIDAQPPMSEELHNAVIDSIRWAWSELRIDPMTSEEEAITSALEELLNAYINGKRRAERLRLFGEVGRSAQYRASDGSFRQTPDLKFQPRNVPSGMTDQSAWGLFAECKIVSGRAHHQIERWYCGEGVSKFADGRYAPKMSTGLMVGYVRDGRKPYPALHPLLVGAFENATVRAHDADVDLLFSHHERAKHTQPCVDITLTHLWLDARPKKAGISTP